MFSVGEVIVCTLKTVDSHDLTLYKHYTVTSKIDVSRIRVVNDVGIEMSYYVWSFDSLKTVRKRKLNNVFYSSE